MSCTFSSGVRTTSFFTSSRFRCSTSSIRRNNAEGEGAGPVRPAPSLLGWRRAMERALLWTGIVGVFVLPAVVALAGVLLHLGVQRMCGRLVKGRATHERI